MLIKKSINPSLYIDGVLLILVDNRTNLAKDIISNLVLNQRFSSVQLSNLREVDGNVKLVS